MDKRFRLLEYVLFIVFTWLSVYEKPVPVIAVLTAVAAIRGVVHSNADVPIVRVTCAMVVAALVWAITDSDDPWYVNFTRGPVYVMYGALLCAILSILSITHGIVMNKVVRLHCKVYYIRTALANFVTVVCATMAAYYLDVAATFVETKQLPSLSATTLAYDKQLCLEADREFEQSSGALYSNVPFTAQCASRVWEQNRTNLLVMLQVHIVFALLVDVPYCIQHRYYNADASSEVKFIILSIVRYAFLFIGVTLVLDQIENWYILNRLEAIMFTLYSVVAAYIDVALKNDNVDCHEQKTQKAAIYIVGYDVPPHARNLDL